MLKTIYPFPSTSQLCATLCWSITKIPIKCIYVFGCNVTKFGNLKGVGILFQGTIYILYVLCRFCIIYFFFLCCTIVLFYLASRDLFFFLLHDCHYEYYYSGLIQHQQFTQFTKKKTVPLQCSSRWEGQQSSACKSLQSKINYISNL